MEVSATGTKFLAVTFIDANGLIDEAALVAFASLAGVAPVSFFASFVAEIVGKGIGMPTCAPWN